MEPAFPLRSVPTTRAHGPCARQSARAVRNCTRVVFSDEVASRKEKAAGVEKGTGECESEGLEGLEENARRSFSILSEKNEAKEFARDKNDEELGSGWEVRWRRGLTVDQRRQGHIYCDMETCD